MPELLPCLQQKQQALRDYLHRPRCRCTGSLPGDFLVDLDTEKYLLQEYRRQINASTVPECVPASIPARRR